MSVLITGHHGFVAKKLVSLHEDKDVHTLEASGDFYTWMNEDLPSALNNDIETIFHIGSISNNQHRDADVYLWNSTATYLIAHAMANNHHLRNCHIVYFSSRAAEWARRFRYEGGASPYGISKMMAEEHIERFVPGRSTILQPHNIWGDERGLYKGRKSMSVPYMLASHTLTFLFPTLSRDFVHVSDVVIAALQCASNRHVGTYEVGTGKCTTAIELREAIDWKDYEIRTPDPNWFQTPEGQPSNPDNWIPNWEPNIEVITSMKNLEKYYQLN